VAAVDVVAVAGASPDPIGRETETKP
jgi:hypothetical protein